MAGFLWNLATKQAPGSIRSLIATRNAAQIPSIHSVPHVRTASPKINHCLESANERKVLLARPGVLGIKRGMISWFTKTGMQYAATVLEVDSCEVISNKTHSKDGYSSVLLGQKDKTKNVTNHEVKICNEAGVTTKANYGEFRVRNDECLIEPGVELTADYFAVGQLVDVKSTTKGKGFAGVMKRHGFKGLSATHGVSLAHRSAGSMGPTQDPGRILPGKKMAGRMGGKSCVSMNLEVLHADGDNGVLVVKGQVPGGNGSYVKIADSKKLYGQSLIRLRQKESE
ncbi:hypothetical protein FT663_03181 [Candidozyma haemuli var. vulneris]|uniref:Large ribosomal subunit protein uL3m n=1 Tax=Candidozyma haemuli TaxID=45357 RepID=A0A2V1ALB9_9ASCO|nr:50S ribosomal protein L3 [[Candida] haemuloni]KAF3987641.1 hypothetical protein FT662_03889 [[Candida] haemuloni var. vulneris]KAF3990423.1 hypothetical protein FT663_03181 [[Candida] haemuloni var. vulneris]PVH18628.1 50S ribosomal protein L3 [[Candida] haemuloni]